ncbi:hypothetical protein F511_31641 [Dorcoceras hygrometricum]|uniref:Uncharacterized protein n=1 Tax=Dorcoceras hygrometricum TaxID=472368 RepID=A0A2Z7AA31_9LAMI|nr:hypothetical protein F511_31641 [Dorcoceras hygrometricum]
MPAPTREEHRAPMPPSSTPSVRVRAIPEVPSSMVGSRTETGPGRAPALNLYEDSLVVSPSGSVAMGLLCNMISNRDVTRVRNTTNFEVVGLFVAQFAAEEALVAKKKAIEVELETLTAKKTAVEVELDETKARAEVEIGCLRSEAANAWGLGKEEFLKSSEFEDVCTKRSLAYFESGFKSCVAQFRDNGYSKEEHPAPSLSVARALDELPDDEEEADNGADEDTSGDEATPPNSPEH